MNTANKRASAIGIGLAIRLVLPIPDATIDAADRQQVAYSYAGIAAGPLVPPPDALLFLGVAVGDVIHFESVHADASAHFDDARVGEACLFLHARVGRP